MGDNNGGTCTSSGTCTVGDARIGETGIPAPFPTPGWLFFLGLFLRTYFLFLLFSLGMVEK